MLIGYARVSTEDQDPALQIAELEAFGCDRIYVDHASGKNLKRPEWQICRRDLREGDTLVVWKLDRLARSVLDLHDIARQFEQEGIQLVVLTQNIDTRTASGRFLFTILGAVAEMERELISERTKAGMAQRKAAGVIMGRRPVIQPKTWEAAQEEIADLREKGEQISKYELKRRMDKRGFKHAIQTWGNALKVLMSQTEYPKAWAEKNAQAKRLAKERAKKNR